MSQSKQEQNCPHTVCVESTPPGLCQFGCGNDGYGLSAAEFGGE